MSRRTLKTAWVAYTIVALLLILVLQAFGIAFPPHTSLQLVTDRLAVDWGSLLLLYAPMLLFTIIWAVALKRHEVDRPRRGQVE